MGPEKIRIGMLVLGLALGGTAVPTAETPEPPAPVAVHTAGIALEDAVVEATRAFLRDDSRAARRALDTLESHCRRLSQEDGQVVGAAVLNYDRAFHTTLTQTREYVNAGKMDDAFNQFVWVQRTCRICHGLAGVKTAPLALEPSTATAPNRRD